MSDKIHSKRPDFCGGGGGGGKGGSCRGRGGVDGGVAFDKLSIYISPF